MNPITRTLLALGLMEYRAANLGRIGGVHTATDGRDILFNSPDGWEVDQPWLWYTGPPNGDGTGGPWGNPPPGAGGPIYGLTALPAVTRCTSIICNTIAGLPWDVLRGDWERLPTPSWISDPQALRLDGRVISTSVEDVRLSAVEFWAQWITAALWFGDGFIYVPSRDSAGQPQPPLYQLHPDMVDVSEGVYSVGGYVLNPLEIIHLRGEPPYYLGRGHGVLTRHAQALGLGLTVGDYTASTYKSGVPAGYLKSTAPRLEVDEAAELKTSWMAAHGTGQRSIAVLNATTEFTPISVSPVDAALDIAKMWTLRDTALAFGVPPYMLGVPGDSSTYTNVESRMIELRQFTLLPWIRRAESTLDAEFAAGTTVKIKTAGLERADTMARYQAYQIGVAGGWLKVDEVRALEDLPPTEGDAPQPNLAPVTNLPTQPPAAAPPTPPPAQSQGGAP
jgi:HK97 family phage portal protein